MVNPSATTNWQGQIVQSGSTMSGGVASGTGTTATGNADAIYINGQTKEQRLALATLLNNAGFKAPKTGNFSMQLVAAFTQAKLAAQFEKQALGQTFDPTDIKVVKDYLIKTVPEVQGAGGTTTKATITNPSTAKALINMVSQNLVGRGATEEELAMYAPALRKAEAANPVVYGDATTSGGLNSEQFLIEQISQSDEAKANKVLGFYDAFKRTIGVA
jgi:hypothetical protein